MSTPPPRPPGPGGAHPARRRRRRRGGGGGRRDDREQQRARAPQPVLPAVSPLAADARSADAPLSPAEVAEMRQHLAFLRRYKDQLRMKLNSQEDLLVNGQREPSDRGVCRHLLGKLDRATIDAALLREPLHSDAAARARMLAGAVRVTADLGTLLSYLEALAQVRSHAEAAQAFGEVVARIDFESLSATRVVRLLQVLIQTFADHERIQVLFSLLAMPGFRRAFDAATPLPPEVADAVLPLRAVHRRLLEGGGTEPPALVVDGMQRVLNAPDPVLRSYVEPLRAAMLELALDPTVPAALADRATGVLLPSLPRDGRLYADLAMRRAAQLLGRHADDRARSVLEELRRAQPGLRRAERLLAALDARRLGRIALGVAPSERGRLADAFWLDGQRPVWLRTATAADTDRLAAEARLQEGLALPGVAAVVEHGVASGIPYVAVAGAGRPWLPDGPLDLPAALGSAAHVARLLRALALGGVLLPDVEPERFLTAPGGGPALVLADFDGADVAEPPAAAQGHVRLAAALARRLLPADAQRRLDPVTGAALARALDAPTDLASLVGALDRALLHAERR